MKPELYQIIARFLYPFEYHFLKTYIRENIGHAVRCPNSATADLVAERSHDLRIQFGR